MFWLFLAIAGSAQACEVRDTRICAIRDIVQALPGMPALKLSYGTTTNGIASEYEWVIGAPSLIHIGDTRYYSDDELFYLVAHEMGHLYYQHGRRMLEALADKADLTLPDIALLKKDSPEVQRMPGSLRAVNHDQEYEADAFAVWLMAKHEKDTFRAMSGVLKQTMSSYYTPARRLRIERAKTLMATIQASEGSYALAPVPAPGYATLN